MAATNLNRVIITGNLTPNDANNHMCVDCACDVPGADPTYCEVKTDGNPACSATASGYPRVCDKETLTCRRKRQNEACDFNTDCGATAPGSTCASFGTVGTESGVGFCAVKSNDGL